MSDYDVEPSSRSLVEAALARAAQVEGLIHSIIELNPEALAIADELDRERAAGSVRGPLHGLPVLLKDNIDTGDAMMTSAGSLALAERPAGRDAFLAKRLREAGAVLLGKTNMSEWANFRSTRSSSGWSSRGGQTRNPYALDRSPCGSSSGSAAAVAAGICSLAVGTETDGSIVCPAQKCGIVGMKPTLGLVSRSGVVPIAHSQDTAGPMASTVAGAALLLGAMAGFDPADPATASLAGKPPEDFLGGLGAGVGAGVGALEGARLGVARDRMGCNPELDALIEGAIGAMRDLGAILVDPAEVAEEKDYSTQELIVLLYEFKAEIAAYLSSRPGSPYRSLSELIAYDEREASRVMPWFGQELFLKAEAKGGLDEAEYLEALEACRRLSRESIDGPLAEKGLDAIIAPTGAPAWPIDLVNGDPDHAGGFSSPAAVAGYPHITVPLGLVRGLPVGISFIGTAWSDAKLLRLANAFERAAGARVLPRFHATVET
jgi:amidase